MRMGSIRTPRLRKRATPSTETMSGFGWRKCGGGRGFCLMWWRRWRGDRVCQPDSQISTRPAQVNEGYGDFTAVIAAATGACCSPSAGSTVSSDGCDSKWPFIGAVLQGDPLAKNVSCLAQTAGDQSANVFNRLLACHVIRHEGRMSPFYLPTVLTGKPCRGPNVLNSTIQESQMKLNSTKSNMGICTCNRGHRVGHAEARRCSTITARSEQRPGQSQGQREQPHVPARPQPRASRPRE